MAPSLKISCGILMEVIRQHYTLHYIGVLAYANKQITSASCMDCVDLIFCATRQNSPNDLDARNWFQPVPRIRDRRSLASLLTKLANKAREWNNNDRNEQNDLLRKETQIIRFFRPLLWLMT